MLVEAILVRHDQGVQLCVALPLRRYVSHARPEHAFDARELLVNHVGGAERRATHRRARHAFHPVADKLPLAEHIEELEAQLVDVVGSLRDLADHNRFHADETPVLEVHVGSVGRLLQHLVFPDGGESSAAAQVVGDHFGDVERHVRRLPLPAERHDRNRSRLRDALHVDDEFCLRRAGHDEPQQRD